MFTETQNFPQFDVLLPVGSALRVKGKGKAGREGSRRSRLPDFIWHMKVVRLSALRTGRLYLSQEIFLVLIYVRG